MTHTEHFLTFWVNISVQNKKTVQEVKGAFGASLLDFLDFDFTDDGEPDA